MSLTIQRQGDTVVLLGRAEPVEYFSTQLLAEADGGHLAVEGDLIVLRGYARRVTYRRLTNVGGEPSDSQFDAAELVSDEDLRETA